jgi:pentatricopeptide repeat protein
MSRLQKAPEMMESLIQQMKDEGLKPDHYSFNTVLHFWSEKGNVRKVEEALAAMQRDGSPPTRTNIAQVLFCYCKVLDLEKANSFLQVFLRMNSQGHAEEQLTWDCGQRILLAYREAVETRDIPHVRKRNMAEQAHVCFEQIMNHCEINCIKAKESKSKLIGTMMDLFCSAGSYDKVEMLVQDRVLNPVLLNILLKALTKDKQVERATSILTNALTGDETSLLNDANGSLSNNSFHTVMNGWVSSVKFSDDNLVFILI